MFKPVPVKWSSAQFCFSFSVKQMEQNFFGKFISNSSESMEAVGFPVNAIEIQMPILVYICVFAVFVFADCAMVWLVVRPYQESICVFVFWV